MDLNSALAYSRNKDRVASEEGSKNDTKIVHIQLTQTLISYIELFVQSSTETFFDDSIFQEIIKLGPSFNDFDSDQIKWLKDTGFLDILTFFHKNIIYAQRVYELLYYFYNKESHFYEYSKQLHFIVAMIEILKSDKYDDDCKIAVLKCIGQLSSNSFDDLCFVIDLSTIKEIYNILFNDTNEYLQIHLLNALIMSAKSNFNSPEHILTQCPISETELFLFLRSLLDSDDEGIVIASLSMLRLVFSCAGSERCDIGNENLADVISILFPFVINEEGETRFLSLDLLQLYSTVYHYAKVLVECDVFGALNEAVSKGVPRDKCLFIISNIISWNDEFIQEAIESGAFSFATDSIRDGDHVESIAACYFLSQLFYRGTIDQIQENMNDELFAGIIGFLSEEDSRLTIALLDSFKRVLELEEKTGQDIIRAHLVENSSYLDIIEELHETNNTTLKEKVGEVLSYFEKIE